jgi:hypothetical protein
MHSAHKTTRRSRLTLSEPIRDAPNHEKGEHSCETCDAFIAAYPDVSIPRPYHENAAAYSRLFNTRHAVARARINSSVDQTATPIEQMW